MTKTELLNKAARNGEERLLLARVLDKLELARRRLIFEELFTLTCGLALLRTRREQAAGAAFRRAPLAEFEALLPFPLTGAQRRAVEEAGADLRQPTPMNRLLQGDVGSGKTVVAVSAMAARPPSGPPRSCWPSSTPRPWRACWRAPAWWWTCSPGP